MLRPHDAAGRHWPHHLPDILLLRRLQGGRLRQCQTTGWRRRWSRQCRHRHRRWHVALSGLGRCEASRPPLLYYQAGLAETIGRGSGLQRSSSKLGLQSWPGAYIERFRSTHRINRASDAIKAEPSCCQPSHLVHPRRKLQRRPKSSICSPCWLHAKGDFGRRKPQPPLLKLERLLFMAYT